MKTTDKMDSDLELFKAPFKQAVLQHIHHVLGKGAWARYRQTGNDRRRSRYSNKPVPAGISPEGLIDMALEETGLSMNELLSTPSFKAEASVVDTLHNQPVYYIHGMGIYFWGKRPGRRHTLHFWATFPAYPPGW